VGKAMLWLYAIVLSTCISLHADPADCPKPTETDNWELGSTNLIRLFDSGCVSDMRTFRVEGFHPPYTLYTKGSGSTGWLPNKEVEGKFIYSACEPPPGSCSSIKIIDAVGAESNKVVLGSVAAMSWNPNNPEEVNPNNQSSVTISVLGGMPPYIWHVGGEGFSFAEEETEEPYNTLLVSSEACGAGDIIVECPCEQAAAGSIRSTNGHWVLVNSCWEEIGPGGNMLAMNWCSSLQPDHYLTSPTVGWTFTKILYRVWKEPAYWNHCADAPCEIPGSPGDPGEGYKISTRYINEFHWECP
jgi:hypothetical protein